MKNAKIVVHDTEILIPVRDEIFGVLCENSHKLDDLKSDVVYLLRQMFPPETQTLTLQVGDAELDFEIEQHLVAALAESFNKGYVVEPSEQAQFEDILRQTVPLSKRPPTSRQYSYMQQIAMTLNLEIPTKALRNTDACSEFIDEHIDEFKLVDSQIQAFRREANRVARWVVAYQLNGTGESLANIAKRLGVVQEATIIKYLNNLDSWKANFVQMSKKEQLCMNDLVNYILESEYENIETFNMFDEWLVIA